MEDGEPVEVESIDLLDERASLPPGWQRVLATLEAGGVRVRAPGRPGPVDGVGDLASVQRFLLDGGRAPMRGDGTVAKLVAETALMAAEAVAEWLGDAPEGENVVVLSSDGDSTLLDRALGRRASWPKRDTRWTQPHPRRIPGRELVTSGFECTANRVQVLSAHERLALTRLGAFN